MIQWEYAELLADQHGDASLWEEPNGESKLIRNKRSAVAYLSQVASPQGWELIAVSGAMAAALHLAPADLEAPRRH